MIPIKPGTARRLGIRLPTPATGWRFVRLPTDMNVVLEYYRRAFVQEWGYDPTPRRLSRESE